MTHDQSEPWDSEEEVEEVSEYDADLLAEDEGGDEKLCPSCREWVSEWAEVCPHCGYWITDEGPAATRAQTWLWPTVVALLIVALAAWLWL